MNFKIIVTFGPALRDKAKLSEINSLGSCIFRLNGAHTAPSQVASTTAFIKEAVPEASVMVDLPGNKVRLQNLAYPLPIVKGEEFTLTGEQFNYSDYPKHLEPGIKIATHDSKYTLEVVSVEGDSIRFTSHHNGTLLPNKGMHAPGIAENLPFLFEKDKELIDASIDGGVDYLSLSFVRDAADIKEVKAILAKQQSDINLISKIETAQAIENLGEIFFEVDSVNVDRGDLSADIGMLKLPLVLERIIESSKRANKELFFATQFLSNMEEHPVPLISEVVDLHKTIKSEISGIQLSEETAVGRYPVECVKLVFDIYKNSFSSS